MTLTTFRDVAWNGPFYSRIGFAEVEDLEAHPRLAKELAEEADDGWSIELLGKQLKARLHTAALFDHNGERMRP